MKRLEIAGYGNYSVDRSGRVYAHHLNKYLSEYDNGLGYMAVKLRKDGKRKQFYVHRLVATTYLDNPYDLPDVNHKDGIKSNNAVDNLEWISKSENSKHAFENDLLSGFLLGRAKKYKTQ